MAIAGSASPGNVTAIKSKFVIATSLLEASAGSRRNRARQLSIHRTGQFHDRRDQAQVISMTG
jgi:hypothetical protein